MWWSGADAGSIPHSRQPFPHFFGPFIYTFLEVFYCSIRIADCSIRVYRSFLEESGWPSLIGSVGNWAVFELIGR